MRILVVTPERLTADQLRGALPGEADPDDSELMVIVPALQDDALHFWFSDVDDAIARAREVQRETVDRLGDEGMAATGDTGDSDTSKAIEDALKTFPADRIVVFNHPEGEQRYREAIDAPALEERFKVPVTQAQVG